MTLFIFCFNRWPYEKRSNIHEFVSYLIMTFFCIGVTELIAYSKGFYRGTSPIFDGMMKNEGQAVVILYLIIFGDLLWLLFGVNVVAPKIEREHKSKTEERGLHWIVLIISGLLGTGIASYHIGRFDFSAGYENAVWVYIVTISLMVGAIVATPLFLRRYFRRHEAFWTGVASDDSSDPFPFDE